MRTYTVHLRDGSPAVLVREGFSWGAALFGPLWLALHRAWIACAFAVAIGIALSTLGRGPAATVLWLGFLFLLGLFGRDLYRWGLARRRYTLAHVIAARDADAAYARLLAARPDLLSAGAP